MAVIHRRIIPRHRPYEIRDVVVVDELALEMEVLAERERMDAEEREQALKEEHVEQLRMRGLL